MKVKALKLFWDREAGEDRLPGQEFEASAERAAEINAAGFGDLVEAVPARPRRKKTEAGE